MRNIIASIGKEFGYDRWTIAFKNRTHNYSFQFQEGFEKTIPFPGMILEENDIKELIEFLQKTLEEEDNEQSNLE